MSITPRVWMALTSFERMAILVFAAEQNLMRWNKKKGAQRGGQQKITHYNNFTTPQGGSEHVTS